MKEPGPNGKKVQYQAFGPVRPAKNATFGKTFTFIEKVELELYDKQFREHRMRTFIDGLNDRCVWPPKMEDLLRLYRENQEVYAGVNKALCCDDFESFEKYAPFIWSLRELFRIPQQKIQKDLDFDLPEGTVLRRHWKLTQEELEMYRVRAKVCWPSFISMVLDRTFPKSDQKQEGSVFTLEFTTQLDLETDSYRPASIGKRWSKFGTEVMLPPHCMLRIQNVVDRGPNCSVDLGMANWIIHLEFAEAPCVWEFIETGRWDDFESYAAPWLNRLWQVGWEKHDLPIHETLISLIFFPKSCR